MGLMMSLNMLVETAAGFDYTSAECIGCKYLHGSHETCVQQLTGHDSMAVWITKVQLA